MKVWKGCLEAMAKIGRQGGDLFCLVLKGGDGGACKLLREIGLSEFNVNLESKSNKGSMIVKSKVLEIQSRESKGFSDTLGIGT
ncbi:hypothetical protein Tco_1147885, partial [Tanacetum coccineum]